MILASALNQQRANTSRRSLALTAGVDPKIIAGLEAGRGTLASLRRVAEALDHYVSPYPSALANKRRWLGIGTRRLSTDIGCDRSTLMQMEATGDGRVETFERVCKALGERPRLMPVVSTWYTPPALLRAVLDGLGLDRFDLDPASPDPPTAPTQRHYTERDGALWLPWTAETVWLNPPYDQVPAWLDKAGDEIAAGRAQRLLALIPYRPETGYFRALLTEPCRIIIFDRRIHFGGRVNHLDSSSALICWGLDEPDLIRLAAHLPANHELAMTRLGNPPQIVAECG